MDAVETSTVSLRDTASQTTRSSGDPRAARTRQAIIGAVHGLIAAGEPAPTVSQIVRRAGISRSSFYTQFANTDDLAAAVFHQAFAEIEDADQALRRGHVVSPAQAARIAAERLVRHVDSHREFYKLSLPASYAGYHQAVGALAAQLREIIPLVAPVPPGVSLEAAALYIAAGDLTILRSWVTGELTATAGEVTDQLLAMLPPWLSSPDPVPSTSPSSKIQ